MRSLILWAGILVLGLVPIDTYIAHNYPNALVFLFFFIPSQPTYTLAEFIFILGAFSFPLIVVLAILHYVFKSHIAKFAIAIPTLASVNVTNFILVSAESGYDNHFSIFLSALSMPLFATWALPSIRKKQLI